MSIPRSERRSGWREASGLYLQPRALRMLALGFSSGLPLLLVFGTLSIWLREAGIDRSTIGFVSWVALAYAFKWVWAPLVDGIVLPLFGRLGRRRGWLLASQLLILLGLVAMAATDPRAELTRLVALAVLVAFSSATQDIIIDAYRIEIGEARLQATFAAAYMMGYRLAMILASAGVLWISAAADLPEAGYQQSSWAVAYLIMASAMGVGILTTLTAPEPNVAPRAASERRGDWAERLRDWLWRVVVAPFAEFLRRYGWRAVLLLALIGTYRISDVVLGVVANVFYLDMGFSKEEIADVTKVFGILMTLLGAALGGGLVTRFGVMPILMLGGALSAATNLMFIQLAGVGHELPMLMVTVGLDNLSAGIASAAFVAYLSGLTNVAFSATQYALFSSVMLVLPKFVGGFSGVMVEGLGYPGFFALTAALGIPVLVLLALAWRVAPVNGVNGER